MAKPKTVAELSEQLDELLDQLTEIGQTQARQDKVLENVGDRMGSMETGESVEGLHERLTEIVKTQARQTKVLEDAGDRFESIEAGLGELREHTREDMNALAEEVAERLAAMPGGRVPAGSRPRAVDADVDLEAIRKSLEERGHRLRTDGEHYANARDAAAGRKGRSSYRSKPAVRMRGEATKVYDHEGTEVARGKKTRR